MVSRLFRKGAAVLLWYLPALTSWGLQRVVQRARAFRASEGAVAWAENPQLGMVGRDPGSEGSGEKCPRVEAA